MKKARKPTKGPTNPLDVAAERIAEALSTGATTLDLSRLGLPTLPEAIGQLQQLQDLDLARNQLTVLPESIGQLKQLQSLDLDSNQLTELPEFIGQLTQLQGLDVSDNQLTVLPESIGQLQQLLELNLARNQLTALLESLGRLTQLQTLEAWSNQLTVLPESIGQLQQLQDLDLASNQLTVLPESIGQLKGLQRLDLDYNQLRVLPESIGQLKQLQSLDLDSNQLTMLPESIGQLEGLQSLNLDYNQLTVLPEALRTLDSLRELYLHGNDLLGLPREVLGASPGDVHSARSDVKPTNPKDILAYYFLMVQKPRPLNEAKLILVGRGGVGKTCIVKRLVHDRFDSGEKTTEGIEITKWPVLLQGNEYVRLHIWDFGGQEIMHATHQFFLTQRSLYLLVLNGREGLEDYDTDYWMRMIESFGGESAVIVVLNRIKEVPFDVNRRAYQQKYPSIREFIKTDCEDGTGCDELRKAIKRETDRLEHLRVKFPGRWFAIKDRLAGMTENYLSFGRYRSLCSEHGEQDKANQEALATHLHNLGIVLNFRKDPRLRDTHVLNPHWVTNGIYKILNSDTLEQQKGQIGLDDLSQILPRNDYPVHMHRFLLDLMRKFDLCFTFPDEFNYLVPELLDIQEPDAAAQLSSDECVSFQYHYPVLPEGLLPRFIVRTNVLSRNQPRWRTGVILEFDGNTALVKADVQDRKVSICVSGPTGGRRSLLAVIRSHFETIHADISNLRPEEMVPLPGHPGETVPYEHLRGMEKEGVEQLQRFVDGKTRYFNVKDLLNGVDLPHSREQASSMDTRERAVRLFISYSHRDEEFRKELETRLTLLKCHGLVDAWHDRRIEPGDDWAQQIDDNLEGADIILLLVSPEFLTSEYCKKETARALERHELFLSLSATATGKTPHSQNCRLCPNAELPSPCGPRAKIRHGGTSRKESKDWLRSCARDSPRCEDYDGRRD